MEAAVFLTLRENRRHILTNTIFACLLAQMSSDVLDIVQNKTYNGVPVSKGLGKELGGL